MIPALTTQLNPDDPAEIEVYPPQLPLEVAMRTASVKELCEAYNLTREQWDALRLNPMFVRDVTYWADNLKKEGGTFKAKARLQAEELLKTSWTLIHSHNDDVSPNVKADLIKFTVRAAGLDGSKDQVNNTQQNALSININLG